MSIKLSKKEHTTMLELVSAVREAKEKADEAVQSYTGALDDLKNFIDDRHQDWRSQWEERSEASQENERGQILDEFIQTYENLEFPEVEELEDPSILDEIEALDTEPNI